MVVKKLLEEFSEEVIRAFVQKNADYYISRWRVMARKGTRVSWNWAAAIFGGWFYQTWFFYRKMFLYGLAVFLLFFALSGTAAFIGGLISGRAGLEWQTVENLLTVFGILSNLVLVILIGLYGNYIYGSFVYKRLSALKEMAAGEEELLLLAAEKGGTSLLLAVAGFLVEMFLLTAITFLSLVVIAS
jgi:hypothetical protein